MAETNLIQLLVQAGAVGISFALIGLLYWLIKAIIGNHLSHTNEIMRQMTGAIQKLSDVIEGLDRRLDSKSG